MEKEISKAIDELHLLIKEPMNELEIIVDDIYFYEKSKNKFLTIILDKVAGIDMDLIVEASKIINKIVDGMNFPCEDYVLDIMSKERG